MTTVVIIAVGVIALAILFVVVTYNGMIRSRNMVDQGWSGIDVQLKRRHDLIPNLVETVKGYAAHERQTFQAVTEARADAMSASGPAASGAAEGVLGQALGRLFAIAEAYPQLPPRRTSSSSKPSFRTPRTRLPLHDASTTATSSRTTRGCRSFPTH